MRQVTRALPGQSQALLIGLIIVVCAAFIIHSEAKAQRRREPGEVNSPLTGATANGAYERPYKSNGLEKRFAQCDWKN